MSATNIDLFLGAQYRPQLRNDAEVEKIPQPDVHPSPDIADRRASDISEVE
jgi:hypothetical protein